MDDESRPTLPKKRQKDKVYEDLQKLLFAFGDAYKPKDETVKVLEEYLLFYIDKLITSIQSRNAQKEGGIHKITKQDVIYAIRNDAKSMSRIAYIIKMKFEFRKIDDSRKGKVNGLMINADN